MDFTIQIYDINRNSVSSARLAVNRVLQPVKILSFWVIMLPATECNGTGCCVAHFIVPFPIGHFMQQIKTKQASEYRCLLIKFKQVYLILHRSNTRQYLSFKIFQHCPTSGRNITYFIRKPKLVNSSHRITTTY